MEFAPLLEALARPAAYPFPVEQVEVRHTHISVVFLAGPRAYKIKKPVRLGFLDYSDVDRRRFYCEKEVRLNRRLAPDIETMYLIANSEYSFVSSSGVKEIAAFGGNVDDLVPPPVALRFQQLFPRPKPGAPVSPQE